jgi:putative membrane protein
MSIIKKISCLLLSILSFASCQNKNKTLESQSDSVSVGQHPDPVDQKEGGNQPKNETHESDVDGDGAVFMRNAALAGIMEVKMGQIAMARATNPEVKAFAAMMVADHTKANMDLTALAKRLGIILPEELPPLEKEHLESMKQLTGKQFDRYYMEMMVKDHAKTVNMFRNATSLNKDLEQFMSRTLLVLEEHELKASEVYQKLYVKAALNKP